jgi:hypothetical protein
VKRTNKPAALASWKEIAAPTRQPTCYEERDPVSPWLPAAAPDDNVEAVEDAEFARAWLVNGAYSSSLGALQGPVRFPPGTTAAQRRFDLRWPW